MRLDMTSGKNCKVKDNLVNQLILLNNKLNSLNPSHVHDEKAREKAEKLTKKVKGVSSVSNQLKVTGA